MMKVAVIGSRTLNVQNLGDYLPPETTEIVSGGAIGIDTCAARYAREHGLKLTEFKPDYGRYGSKAAPLKRNVTIVEHADMVLAFWDGKSRGTAYTLNLCKERNKPYKIIRLDKNA